MKSNYKNVNICYIELPLKVFLRRFPEFPLPVDVDINDVDYVVRYGDVDGNSIVEFGYPSDEWIYFK